MPGAREIEALGFGESTFRFAGPPGALRRRSKTSRACAWRPATRVSSTASSTSAASPSTSCRWTAPSSPPCVSGWRMPSPTSSRPAPRCEQAGLEIFGPVILESEAVLIAAPTRPTGTETLLRRLRGVMVARRYVLIDYDLPASLVDAAVAIAPGIESPTISPLRDPEWVAVRVMSPRKDVNQVMDALYAIGARAILVTAIHAARL